MTGLGVALILVVGLGIPAAVYFGIEVGRARMADAVARVWVRNDGWIPGSAVGELEWVTGRELPTSQEITFDQRLAASTNLRKG